jgi:hypothetical protein
MLKPNQWFAWNKKPKNPHSLEQLKYYLLLFLIIN